MSYNYDTFQNPSESTAMIAKSVLLTAAIGISLAGSTKLHALENTLNYRQPAGNWAKEALPIGNGRLGAMIFGGIGVDVVQFNEISLWSGDNNWDGAYQTGDHGFGSYRNFGELRVEFIGGQRVHSPTGHDAGNGQAISNTLDTSAESKWCIENPGAMVQWQIDLPAGQQVASYSLTSAPDVPARDPQNWVLEGSSDGTRWVELDRRTEKPFDSRGQSRQFTIAKPADCRYYRFTFATAGFTHFQVAGIALAGVQANASGPAVPADYQRSLDITKGLHVTRFSRGGTSHRREGFASHPDQVIALRYSAEKPGSLGGRISLQSAQGAKPTANATSLTFDGTMPNSLRHAAMARVLPVGGKVRADGDVLVFENCDSLVILLNARTDYKPDFKSNWRGDAPLPRLTAEIDAAARKDFAQLLTAHVSDLGKLLDRANIDLGTTPADLLAKPTDERKKLYAAGGEDPDLEELMFQYGRYLLASCSRPGGLPANLQGLWNNSNTPPWASDYHNNINVQMNYWHAETTNLSECHRPLIDYIIAQAEPCRIATRKAFGPQTRGWTARTSQNIFGGNGWEWNIPASAWYATHVFEHWAFTRDRSYLEKTAYPLLKEICELWEDRLKDDGTGKLVVPNGWSPEHGPREDGVMHDQQLIWELFEDYLEAARELGVDAAYQTKIAGMQARLAPNKIGQWGQLQEWQSDRDNPDDQHRHTSHLFGVYPGRQISLQKTPDLAAAAIISLRSRSGNFGKNKDKPFTVESTVGDSRQSWAWPWRGALWARLGESEKAGIMVRGLLTYNSTDNLFCLATNVFQMDGNFGISAAMAEMLLQSHAGEIVRRPALPPRWAATGSFHGLRARGGHTVDCQWKDGKVVDFKIRSTTPAKVKVRVNGEVRTVQTQQL